MHGVGGSVGRQSLDSAFGQAQRAIHLSTLSMPDRIAFMQVPMHLPPSCLVMRSSFQLRLNMLHGC